MISIATVAILWVSMFCFGRRGEEVGSERCLGWDEMMKMFQGDAMRHPTLKLTLTCSQIATAAPPPSEECLARHAVGVCCCLRVWHPSVSLSIYGAVSSVDLFNVLFIKIKREAREQRERQKAHMQQRRAVVAHQIEQLDGSEDEWCSI